MINSCRVSCFRTGEGSTAGELIQLGTETSGGARRSFTRPHDRQEASNHLRLAVCHVGLGASVRERELPLCGLRRRPSPDEVVPLLPPAQRHRYLSPWTSGFYTLLPRLSSQSLRLPDAGVPPSSSAELRWSRDGARLSVLAELQAGPESLLKAEFNGGQTEDGGSPRWEYSSRLQHEVRALLQRGVPRSAEGKAHYQVDGRHRPVHFFQSRNTCLVLFFFTLFSSPLSAGGRRTGRRFGPSHGRQEDHGGRL